MRLEVRKTTPLTRDEADDVATFAGEGTPEHVALSRISPVPLRNSEGATLRALTLLGMQYVRERLAGEATTQSGYAAMAATRSADDAATERGRRRNMKRMAAHD